MVPGVGGRLLSASFARAVLPTLVDVRESLDSARRAVSSWATRCDAALGPASSLRAIADVGALPLCDILGYSTAGRYDTPAPSGVEGPNICRLTALAANGPAAIVVIVPWAVPLDSVWRDAVRAAIAADLRWCFCFNGIAFRIVDAQRTWSRQYLEFEIAALPREPDALTLFWSVARADGFAGVEPLLDRAVELSARHGVAVCRALGDGVLEALGTVMQSLARSSQRRRPVGADLPASAEASAGRRSARTAREGWQVDPTALFEQSLTVLYRVLFLLFAEARGLVPVWHPLYRDRYTIDAIVSTLLAGAPCRGVWPALQAISRLAHAGCRAGELRVTAFNGRLFSPTHTPVAERGHIDDETMRRAVLAVSTTADGRTGGRARIVYRDLDVEQLGAVYEHVLDYEPVLSPAEGPARNQQDVVLTRTSDLRKASGTFYTPRSMTDYLVRHTLAPLVAGRAAEEILGLRILDPAMGSGAFLVAACRYLASSLEEALVREGAWHPADVTADDRAMLRRDIAQRCLFGVDVNPMAVQLARLSLWLATLAADRPLTFLDHHLVSGDSLIGASLEDVARQPPGGRARGGRPASLPLFDDEGLAATLRDVVPTRIRLARERDEHVDVVKRKEAALAALEARRAPLSRWKSVLDLWCSAWFCERDRVPSPAVFADLAGAVLHGRRTLPSHVADDWLMRIEQTAERRRFLHWTLEFPEVFFDDDGLRRAGGGFDAVLGNPPWDMVRGDSGGGRLRRDRRADARQLVDFVREAGVYHVETRSHVNRYQLFVERALQLVRAGGRIGLVLPSGVVSDAGSAPLRRHLFDRADVDSVTGLDNRAGIFPIHRSVRFVLLTATAGRETVRTSCRFGVTDPDRLQSDRWGPALGGSITITRSFLARISGEDDLGIPELATPADLGIVDKVSATVPWLGLGWNVHFGRELNASDDRGAFSPASETSAGRPVLEGKQIEPFRVSLQGCRYELNADAAVRVRVPRRPRLAYRDVASATNRLTLIAAIVPARAVTTHTLFCLKTPMALDRQLVLCALLNSYVANYLIRLRVNTHVTSALMSRLPVPVVEDTEPTFEKLRSLARALIDAATPVESLPEYAELQAIVARLYGLSSDEFEHVLSTFPLVLQEVRSASLARFNSFH
jgi:hypothetical protein